MCVFIASAAGFEETADEAQDMWLTEKLRCGAVINSTSLSPGFDEASSTGSRDEASAWATEPHADADSLRSYTETPADKLEH